MVYKVRLEWWTLMLMLYSASVGHGKVDVVDAYVGAV